MKKLLKSIILTIALSAAATASLSASPGAINFNNIPQTEELTEKIYTFMTTCYGYLRYWTNQTYDEKAQLAQELLDDLNAIKKPNVDVQLLKLMVMRCLYNQDKCTPEEMEQMYNSIVKKFPKSAEVHWVYGNYLTTTTHSVQALEEMDKYYEMRDGYVSLYFMEDYAVTNMACDKKLQAMVSILTFASVMGKDPEEYEVYRKLKNQIIESSVTESYTAEQTWTKKLVKQEGDVSHYKFESSMLGASIPVQGQWGLKYSGYQDNQIAYIVLTPDSYKVKDKNVGFSVIIFITPKVSSVMDTLDNAKIQKIEKKEYNGVNWTVYTYEDKSRYQDFRKGVKGYIYEATIEPTMYSGFRCETPLNLNLMLSQNDGDNQVNYYKTKPAYTRLPAKLQVEIFVESCNAIDKETKKFLDQFMSEAIFE